MNFSKIHYQSVLGKILRLPLRLIPKKMVLPIMQGRLKGKKWIVGSGEHGYWLGSYEMRKRTAFEKEITSGSVIYDIGANVGYYSLLASVLAGQNGKVFAFEPLPRNLAFFHQHVQLNKSDNIKIFEVAVSDKAGEGFFDLGHSSAMGHLAEAGQIKVKIIKLDDLLLSGEIDPPDFIKLDVEGAEFHALNGGRQLLEKYHPVLFLDTHDRKAHVLTLNLLEEYGYHFDILDGKTLSESKELIARADKGVGFNNLVDCKEAKP
jgi:FkbM family methyltransferase